MQAQVVQSDGWQNNTAECRKAAVTPYIAVHVHQLEVKANNDLIYIHDESPAELN